MGRRNWRITNNVARNIQRIGVLLEGLPAELPTDGETHAASRQLDKRCRIDRAVDRGQFRGVFVLGMDPGKVHRSRIRCNWAAKIAERIERGGRSDELRRGRIKDRIGRVQDPIEERGRYLLARLRILKLAVAECSVVAPRSIKQFVSFDAKRAQVGIGLVVEQSIPEFSQTRASASRYNLLERVKRIECICRKIGVRMGWCVRGLRAGRNRCLRRYGKRGLAFRLKGAASRRRQFVMRFHVLIKKVAIDDHLISQDLMFSMEITAVTLLLRERK